MPKSKAKQPTVGVTNGELPSNAECAARFIKWLPTAGAKADSGANSSVSDFMLWVAQRLVNQYRHGFTVNDAITLTKTAPKELDIASVLNLFTLWTRKMTEWGKLSKQESLVYDDEIYVWN